MPLHSAGLTVHPELVSLPPAVSELLTADSGAWGGLEPHWGSRAIAGAAASLAERAGGLAPPALPEAAQLGDTVRGALAPLLASAPATSSTAPAPLSISLPQPPQLDLSLPSSLDLDFGALGGQLGGIGANLVGGAAGVAGGGLEALRAGASQASASAGAALATGGVDWGRGAGGAADVARRRRSSKAVRYVKVAQALSTRVDLLTPAYFEQIQRLQDRVPPFPCEQAKAEMERAFGRSLSSVFARLSEQPVAAASLGQVYRATLLPELGGGDVAVKVQRPELMEQVSLDLLIMRRLAVAMKEQLQLSSDWAAIIDAWAVRFFHELDYGREAANAATFAAQMAAAGVEGITVAEVRRELSSDTVLTTAWVEGEKLSESTASDVRTLCSTLLNAYLIQLLDTGFLHADPHPGNLIRTPDGRICVLDFGLMTEITPEQRLALVEYIAHLSTQDWEALAGDLQTLGFIPPEVDTRAAGLVEPLGRVMVQLVGGGGAAKVNIDKVTADLEALGQLYPITVPPFFALILRAFSVIEGIALRVDPNYSIVGECFPYLATRLLRDDDPRMRALLKDLLYGGKPRIDAARLQRLADGLAAFTTDGLAADGAPAAAAPAQAALVPAGAGTGGSTGPVLSPAVVSALRQALRPGSYASELLVEEMVVAVDALSRDALSRLLGRLLGSAPAALALRSVEALGPLRSVLLPLPTPVELLSRLAPAVAVTPEDQEALALVRALLQLSQRLAQSGLVAEPGAVAGTPAGARAAQLAAELGGLLPELAPRGGGGGGGLSAARGSGGGSAEAEAAARVPQPAIAMRMMPLGGSGGAGAGRPAATSAGRR
ncbi:hypothetical protein GPECTOR_50g599 [Gonium pectorale]|uniref:Protein kinase domain-containing protein n=1 Tax=Gonium pectorale TaxID=33097 RepID=A0A150G8B7_GONPE|nr:hypothetical protein GPECTOR_50g599 [Gonium pectorale]|eukprot:KXZ45805.1 hypothetical protein GPECTOR_50g599 [Gonium pectorale]